MADTANQPWTPDCIRFFSTSPRTRSGQVDLAKCNLVTIRKTRAVGSTELMFAGVTCVLTEEDIRMAGNR